ncbi:ECF transporter S component [Mycoplasmopsis citelli]|uniref:ECF transporter S component n=1 Tax=Mycoplasmopsis citelli TaxID=171281 RepID=UPI002114A557|nr:ECF transporter S component [Mycoplasmopsis citelli]UUD36089.1 ECF transporter S component [Mycoplasmopsis citelli]
MQYNYSNMFIIKMLIKSRKISWSFLKNKLNYLITKNKVFNSTSLVVYLAMWLSLFILLTFTRTGVIPLGPVSLNLITFLVILMGIHLGFKGSFFGGIFLGLCSFFGALTFGSFLFIYPLISILPRFILGFFVYFLCKIAQKIVISYVDAKNQNRAFKVKLISYFFVGAFSALGNTIFVSIGLFTHKLIFGLEAIGSLKAWLSLIWIQALFEFVSIGFLCMIMSGFLYELSSKKSSFLPKNRKW